MPIPRKLALCCIAGLFLTPQLLLAQGQILHVIYIVKENRTLNNYFATFPGATGSLNYTTSTGTTGTLTHANPLNAYGQCGHEHPDSVKSIGGTCSINTAKYCTLVGGQCVGGDGICNVGAMNGFDRITPCETAQSCLKPGGTWTGNICTGSSMAINNSTYCYTCSTNADCASVSGTCVPAVNGNPYLYLDGGDIPYYWMLAGRYGLADHFFSSESGPSYPNHKYIVAGDDDETAQNPGDTRHTDPNFAGWSVLSSATYGTCTSPNGYVCHQTSDCVAAGGTGPCNIPTSPPFLYDMSGINNYSGAGQFFSIANGNNSPSGFSDATHYVGGRCNYTSPQNIGAACRCSFPTGGVASTPCAEVTANCGSSVSNGNHCNLAACPGGSLGCLAPTSPTIWDRLDTMGVTWKVYAPGFGTGGYEWNVPGYYANRYNSPNLASTAQLLTDIQNSTLPQVAWLIPEKVNSEHDAVRHGVTVHNGEQWTSQYLNALFANSTLYGNTVVFITWDDFGGYFDPVNPTVPISSITVSGGTATISWTGSPFQPNATIEISNTSVSGCSGSKLLLTASSSSATFAAGSCTTSTGGSASVDALGLGIRVPFLCIGPYCKNRVDHSQYEFSSVLKYLETRFGLSSLNKRDASANTRSIGEMIDLSQPPIPPPTQ